MEWLIDILTKTDPLILILIFVFKIIEVTVSTLRIILINKGFRKIGVILAAVEIILWLILASTVITGISESPMKGVAYGLGFIFGVFTGSILEEKLAFGKVLIQAITPIENGHIIAASLRKNGYGVTILDGKGKEEKRLILMILANRRDISIAVSTIKEIEPTAMIVSHETVNLAGGFTQKIRHLFK
ncbi:MAG: DUF5698 domain-containing protein [Acholeplasmatales bacterium]|jgi:uncharacterized protein YebE (UPF0316 family)|nr:DUF5698 domain-containing protein [Acholeplasmataceae bacterium]MDY0114877.1 DUF5698 domain-containing protein [Acholeplasmatales bacterium]MCK9234109.1 DUF5698 domain-containing protein [Acholeplasmataceae bacterium]MCK9288739.1 DUF5698 domain-containing protein [Acholeplasmataceae bacterium]MCK9427355.1 DUF5698 domain-containing protein [Acholeplasmataceae bacterium]